MGEPTGIRDYGLTMPTSNPFTWDWQPLRNFPSAAEQIAAILAAATRDARVKQAAEDALAEWRQFADLLAGNPIALAALGCHRPEVGYDRVVCGECCESDGDDAVDVEWPCVTYAAMRAAR